MGSNRRTAPRVPRHIMVRYRGPEDKTWQVTTLRDFSLGGARLLCDRKYDTSSKLALQFGLPIFDPPVTLECTVRWVEPLSGAFNVVMHGVAFPELESSVRQRIAQTMEKELQAQAKEALEGDGADGDAGRQGTKRTATRADKNFSVHLRPSGMSAWSMATLRDISLGGARLYAQEAYREGEAIEVKIGLPLFASPVVLSAHIVRKEAVFKGKVQVTTYGIAFDMLPNAVRQALGQRIEGGLKKKQSAKPPEVKQAPEAVHASPVVKRLNVRYRTLGERNWKTTYLRDFSVRGAQFVAEERFTQGDLVEIGLYLPQTEVREAFKARIDWREGLAEHEGSLQRYGITFEFDAPEKEKAMVKAVAYFLQTN